MTTRPVQSRPGNGYGRSLQPGPDSYRAWRLLANERRSTDRRADLTEAGLGNNERRVVDARERIELRRWSDQLRG